mgnify:CR=1 FL=1
MVIYTVTQINNQAKLLIENKFNFDFPDSFARNFIFCINFSNKIPWLSFPITEQSIGISYFTNLIRFKVRYIGNNMKTLNVIRYCNGILIFKK